VFYDDRQSKFDQMSFQLGANLSEIIARLWNIIGSNGVGRA